MSKYTDWLARTGGARLSGLNKGLDRNSPSHFEVSYDVVEVAGEEPPPEIADELTQMIIRAESDPTAVLPRVRELLRRYPDEPHLLNKLVTGLAADGQKDEARAVAERNYLKNPDYLFARLNYAEFLLAGSEHERVPEIFGGTFNLRMMYPQRTVFHVTEVAGLMSVLTRYYLLKRDAVMASNAIQVLQEVDPDHPTMAFAKQVVALAALQGMIEQVKAERRTRDTRKGSRRRDRRDRKRR